MSQSPSRPLSNAVIAAVFDRVAGLLQAQEANAYRVRAYREAAATLRHLDQRAVAILDRDGREALVALPTIGVALAGSIDELGHTGSLRLLDRLEGQHAPEDAFAAIPGIGDELAHRIHDDLDIDTVEDLEAAARDGRLLGVTGIGPERVASVAEYLATHLERSGSRRAWARVQGEVDHHPLPDVGVLLGLDAEYRQLADKGKLELIAPRRLNPENHRWLPIWHTEKDGFSYTILFSNSAQAHRLGKVRDWVVLYFETDGEEEQCTVVTEYRGKLTGRRVVRGREAECETFYAGESVTGDVRAWAHAVAEKLDD